MVAKNEHTGAALRTKAATDKYRSGWDKAFGKKKRIDWAKTTKKIKAT